MGDVRRHDQAQRLRQLAAQGLGARETGMRETGIKDTGTGPAIGPEPSWRAATRRGARVLAVTSGKGGVGKTSVSVNLAIALGQQGLSVGLVDADLGLANLDLMLGVLPKYDLTSIITGQKTAAEALVDGPAGIKLLAGGASAAELADLSDRHLKQVLGVLAELDGMFDVYLFDTGAGIGRQVMTFVAAADEVLVVTTPDPTAVADAYRLIKVLRHSTRGALEPVVRVVVTMAETEAESLAVFRRLDQVTRRFLGLSLRYLGCLEKDAAVARAVREQRPFALGQPNSRPARRVLGMAAGMVREWQLVREWQNGPAGARMAQAQVHGGGQGRRFAPADASAEPGPGSEFSRSGKGLAGAVWRMWRALRGA